MYQPSLFMTADTGAEISFAYGSVLFEFAETDENVFKNT
jgi:hypothetical protein